MIIKVTNVHCLLWSPTQAAHVLLCYHSCLVKTGHSLEAEALESVTITTLRF